MESLTRRIADLLAQGVQIIAWSERLKDDDALKMLAYSRKTFMGYLMRLYADPMKSQRMKLSYLDHLDRRAKETGVKLDKDEFDSIRGLIKGYSL
jgi:hypothetical protein